MSVVNKHNNFQILKPLSIRKQVLPDALGDPVCDHDGQFAGGLDLSQGVGQDQRAQRVRVIGGECYERLVLGT